MRFFFVLCFVKSFERTNESHSLVSLVNHVWICFFLSLHLYVLFSFFSFFSSLIFCLPLLKYTKWRHKTSAEVRNVRDDRATVYTHFFSLLFEDVTLWHSNNLEKHICCIAFKYIQSDRLTHAHAMKWFFTIAQGINCH